MSSDIYITLGTPVSLADWEQFCAGHGITYNPHAVGWNVYYAGQVEITFGDHGTRPVLRGGRYDWDTAEPPASAEQVWFSTFWMGVALPQVAALARAFHDQFGGDVSMAPELEGLFYEGRTPS